MEHLTITRVDKLKGYLAIHGHKKPELLEQLQAIIDGYVPNNLKQKDPASALTNIEFDTMYLVYECRLRKFHRCFVIEKRPDNKVVIDLMDYGTEFEVATKFVRFRISLSHSGLK